MVFFRTELDAQFTERLIMRLDPLDYIEATALRQGKFLTHLASFGFRLTPMLQVLFYLVTMDLVAFSIELLGNAFKEWSRYEHLSV